VVSQGVPDHLTNDRLLQHSFVVGGEIVPPVSLAESREHLRQCLISIPWEGLKLSAGDPAIPVTIVPTA
jgi:nicotinate phosphoribosyltransferase